MKNIFTLIRLTLALMLASGCATTPIDLSLPISERNKLYYEVYGDTNNMDNPKLVVFLPGDTGNNGGLDSRYFFDEAKFVANTTDNVIVVSILRPGTRDGLGNKSPGFQDRSDDNKTSDNIGNTAHTIAHLKKKYSADHVISVGHSGGAMMLGVIIGLYPELLNSVVMTSTVCDIPAYRVRRRGVNGWPRSLSPKNFIEGISSDTVIRLITGSKDANTIPKFAKECEMLYQKQELDVELQIVKGATHDFGSLRIPVRRAIDSLLK